MVKRELAHELRRLRTEHWPGKKINQDVLAKALDVRSSSVSMWESPRSTSVPPVRRLEDYARIFCTDRSFNGDSLRVLDDRELTSGERAEMERLRKHLLGLRPEAQRQAHAASEAPFPGADPWVFTDGKPITIVTAEMPADLRPVAEYSSPTSPHYVESYRYADLDAMFELHGHIRAANPASHVTRCTHTMLTADLLAHHLVLLGGVDWNQTTTDALTRINLPIRQVNDWDGPQGPYFEADGERHHPKTAGNALLEDVALFYRGPNPLNKERTLTIANGMYGRGTWGAVRTLTDAEFRERNSTYIRERYAGCTEFAILTRVTFVQGEAITPDWTIESSRLFEWHTP